MVWGSSSRAPASHHRMGFLLVLAKPAESELDGGPIGNPGEDKLAAWIVVLGGIAVKKLAVTKFLNCFKLSYDLVKRIQPFFLFALLFYQVFFCYLGI